MKLAALLMLGAILGMISNATQDYEIDSPDVTPAGYAVEHSTTTTVAVHITTTTRKISSSSASAVIVDESADPHSTSSRLEGVTLAVSRTRCGMWASAALRAGWPEERLDILLDDIIWDESRCQADATNGSDWGLLQINWTTWRHYIESFGLTRNDLLIPQINLWIGAQIAAKALDAGWRWCQPWDSSQVRSCSQ